MVDDFWLDGSGAKCSRCALAAALRSTFTTPGCTTASRATGSIRTMRFETRQRNDHARQQPAPSRPTARCRRRALPSASRPPRRSAPTAATSAVLSGTTTISGTARSSALASYSYSISSARRCSTYAAPIAANCATSCSRAHRWSSVLELCLACLAPASPQDTEYPVGATKSLFVINLGVLVVNIYGSDSMTCSKGSSIFT